MCWMLKKWYTCLQDALAIRHFSLVICSCARSAKRRKETEKNGSKNEKSSITKINNFHRKMTFKRTISIPKIGLNSFQSPRPVCTSLPLLLKLFFISKCLNCYLVQRTLFGINTSMISGSFYLIILYFALPLVFQMAET